MMSCDGVESCAVTMFAQRTLTGPGAGPEAPAHALAALSAIDVSYDFR